MKVYLTQFLTMVAEQVLECSCDADGGTIVGSTEDHTPRQNLAADCETGRRPFGSPAS